MGENPANQYEVGSLSHHLQSFIHPRWLALGFLNTSTCSAGQASFLQPAPPVRFASKAILEGCSAGIASLLSPKKDSQSKFTS